MKSYLKTGIALLFFLAFLFSSCSKTETIGSNPGINPPPPPYPPPSPTFSNIEAFWGRAWQATATGYEIHVTSQQLTQDRINRGIIVRVAIAEIDNGPWVAIPASYYNSLLIPDTVYLSYTVTPGHLYITGQGSFDLSRYISDVTIEYR